MKSPNSIKTNGQKRDEKPAQLPLYIDDSPPPGWKPTPKPAEKPERGIVVIIGNDEEDGQTSGSDRGVVVYQM